MEILIAEDDNISRRILETILKRWGYGVVSVGDGREAWTKLQEKDAPRLVILDWMMPGMDGIEICRRVRRIKHAETMYIILLTARGDKKDIIKGLEAGADDYIAKPFDNDELHARVNVGRRVVELQSALIEKEKLQVICEMAGAVCHELSQPMQVISGNSELLLMDIQKNHTLYRNIKAIKDQIDRMGDITRKFMKMSKYKTKDYLNSKIIDIERSSV